MLVICFCNSWSFPSRISSINMAKSGGNCGSGQIYWRNPQRKIHCLCRKVLIFWHFWDTKLNLQVDVKRLLIKYDRVLYTFTSYVTYTKTEIPILVISNRKSLLRLKPKNSKVCAEEKIFFFKLEQVDSDTFFRLKYCASLIRAFSFFQNFNSSFAILDNIIKLQKRSPGRVL